MMHQVLCNAHVTLFIGQLHNIYHLVHHDMPNPVSSAFYTIPIFPFEIAIFFIYLSLFLFLLLLVIITLDIIPTTIGTSKHQVNEAIILPE